MTKSIKPNQITQDDVNALWLASRVTIDIGDNPRNLRARATARLKELVKAGIVEWPSPWRDQPMLKEEA